jgi:hypothetical protein
MISLNLAQAGVYKLVLVDDSLCEASDTASNVFIKAGHIGTATRASVVKEGL